MTYRTISANVDVEVDLEEFDTDDLIDELECRGYVVNDADTDGISYETRLLIGNIYEAKRNGQDFGPLLNQLIYQTIGRIL